MSSYKLLQKRKLNYKKLRSIIEKQPKHKCQTVVIWNHGSFWYWSWTIILNVLIYNNACDYSNRSCYHL